MDRGELRPVARRFSVAAIGLPLVYLSFLFVWPFTGTSASFFPIASALGLGLLLVWRQESACHQRISTGSLLLLTPLVLYFVTAATCAAYAADTKNLLWLLFGVLWLCTLLGRKVDAEDYLAAFQAMCFCALALYMYSNIDSILATATGRVRSSFGNEAYTLSAYALATSIVVGMYTAVHAPRQRIVAATLSAMGLFCVVSTGTRSIYIGLLLAFSVIFVAGLARKDTRQIAMRSLLAGGVVTSALFVGVPQMRAKVAAIYEMSVRGSSVILSGAEDTYEASALARFENRDLGWRNFSENVLLGAGYKYDWLDFPLLQAFQDLGIVFGVVFGLAFIIIPAVLSVQLYRSGIHSYAIIALCYILNAPRLFFHGQPYDWINFVFVVPVYAAAAAYMSSLAHQAGIDRGVQRRRRAGGHRSHV